MTGLLAGQMLRTGFLRQTKGKILLALCSVSDKHGQSWYGYDAIAHHARCTRETAMSAISWLEQRGLLIVIRRPFQTSKSGKRTGRGNLYTLNLGCLNAIIKLSNIVYRATPGSTSSKWKMVARAMNWAEGQVIAFNWGVIVDLVNERPHIVMQIVCGEYDAPERVERIKAA